jgi:hypothetical protein
MTLPRSTSEAVESSKWRDMYHIMRGVDVVGWKSHDYFPFTLDSYLKLSHPVGDILFILSLSAHIKSYNVPHGPQQHLVSCLDRI